MTDFEKNNAMKRLKEEFKMLSTNSMISFGLTIGLPDENNIFVWRLMLVGPKDTLYKGGLFFINIIFPEDYPNHPPEFCFKTPIYHANVNPIKSNRKGSEPIGKIHLPLLNSWKPETNIRDIIISIHSLFYIANPDNPFALYRAREFKENRALYNEKVKYFTLKYASLYFKLKDEHDESWDFSFSFL